MFERFTDDARGAVALAQEEAVALHHGWIGTEHLLLGVLRGGAGGARLLQGFGVDHAAVREEVERTIGRGESDIDRDALATLGIDLDAVRERVERAFGPGALSRRRGCRRGRLGRLGPHVPFTPRAKKALELTLRESLGLDSREITGEHVVLGLLREGDGVAAEILTARGVTLEAARSRVQGRDAA
jgi:ATP-dependent Clp protease ATP-binding subunit ClpA